MASISPGWSLPKLAKMKETPHSPSASSNAVLAVYMTNASASGEGIGDLLEQRDELGLAVADDFIEPAIVVHRMREKVLERRLAGLGQPERNAPPVAGGGMPRDEAMSVQLLDEWR